MTQRKANLRERSIPGIVATVLVAGACTMRMAGNGFAQPLPPIVAESVVVGVPGSHLFAGLPGGSGEGGQQAASSNVVVIGASSYISLQPTANDLLSLETTSSTNLVTLRVYSRDFIYSLVAEDSTANNGRAFASLTFPATAGAIYDVQFTGVGTVTLTFKLGQPPSFLQTPTNRVVPEGCPVTLTAAATGQPLPSYQWNFNGVDLPGETNATLAILNAPSSRKGKYRVRAQNFLDTVTSPEADLDVVPTVIGPVGPGNTQPFQFTLNGVPGQSYTIEASTNLATWAGVTTTNAATDGTLRFGDTLSASFAARFFRVRTICP